VLLKMDMLILRLWRNRKGSADEKGLAISGFYTPIDKTSVLSARYLCFLGGGEFTQSSILSRWGLKMLLSTQYSALSPVVLCGNRMGEKENTSSTFQVS
jgi:hypothetical protein